MIELEKDQLAFRFPDVHRYAVLRIGFQRTLRIPDDARRYPLPPGLGLFPLRHVDDLAANVPGQWIEHGGVMLPMYQSEALWPHFRGHYPFAVKVATGKIDAVTGKELRPGLARRPQNYLSIPEQPWLDGYCVEKGVIRQFVAMPLGKGYTAEEQITGRADVGVVFPGSNALAVAICASIYFVPGFGLTLGASEPMAGDTLSGLIGFTRATVAAVKLVIGALIVSAIVRGLVDHDTSERRVGRSSRMDLVVRPLAGALPGHPVPRPAQGPDMASPGGNHRLGECGGGREIGLLAGYVHRCVRSDMSASKLFARAFRLPSAIILLPAVMLLVPGVPALRALYIGQTLGFVGEWSNNDESWYASSCN